MKSAVTLILLAFVAASVLYLALGERGSSESARVGTLPTKSAAPEFHRTAIDDDAQERTEERVGEMPPTLEASDADSVANLASASEARTVIVYYFHRTQRCKTCLAMQEYAADALKDGLTDALDSGALQWRVENVEQPANEHFVGEYDLYASALVMAEMEGSTVRRSKKLEEIWDLVGDEWKFKEFVRDEALAYLDGAP